MFPLRFGISPGYAIIAAIVLVAVVIYTILAVRKQASAAEKKKEPNPSLKQLEERYQRGEINREDYESKRKRLKNSRGIKR